MDVQTKTTSRMRRAVKYRFLCEQCREDSGWMTHTLRAKASVEAREPDSADPTAAEQVRADVRAALDTWRKRVEKGKYDPPGGGRLKGKCPHCKARQSWARRLTLRGVLGTCIAGAAIGLLALLPFGIMARESPHMLIVHIPVAGMQAGFFVGVGICIVRGIVLWRYRKGIEQEGKPVFDFGGTEDA